MITHISNMASKRGFLYCMTGGIAGLVKSLEPNDWINGYNGMPWIECLFEPRMSDASFEPITFRETDGFEYYIGILLQDF